MEPLIEGGTISGLALGSHGKSIIEEPDGAFCSLGGVPLGEGLRKIHKGLQSACPAYQKVP